MERPAGTDERVTVALATTAGGRGSAAEPWTGLTLEWATDSPPPVGNFAKAPVVTSAHPLAEEA